MNEAEKIAAGLSEAQRAMLLWLVRFRLLPWGWTRWRLQRKGLIQPWLFRGSWGATVLGDQVTAILERESNGR